MGDITNFSILKKTSVLVIFLIVSGSFAWANSSTGSNSSQVDENQIMVDLGTQSAVSLDTAFAGNSYEKEISLDDSTSSGSGVMVFVRMILVLAVVLGLIYFMFWLIKRQNNPTGDDDPFLRRVSSVSMGPGRSVQVITLVDKAYIVGVSENSVNVIDKVEDQELVNALNLYADKNSNTKKPKNFEEILNIFTGKPKKESKNAGVYDGSTQQVLDMLKKQSDRLNDGE